MALIQIKRGETFRLTMALQNDDGTPIDLSLVAVTAQIRDAAGNLIETPTITPVPGQVGVATVDGGDTSLWPSGSVLRHDYRVAIVAGGEVVISDMVGLHVAEPVTGGAA